MKRIGGASGTFFTPDETEALLEAARSHSERDYLMLLLTVNHALRASELLAIEANDIRDKHLYTARMKGSKRTVQPLTDAELESLNKLFTGIRPDGRLFPITRMQLWRVVQKHCKTAGISRVAAHPHSLKHTNCRTTLAQTGNLRAVQVIAGHSSITSTLEYTKLTDAEAWALWKGSK
jgi:integrase